jgi:hypothetical protein
VPPSTLIEFQVEYLHAYSPPVALHRIPKDPTSGIRAGCFLFSSLHEVWKWVEAHKPMVCWLRILEAASS